MMTAEERFGCRVRQLREQQHLTQEYVATALNASGGGMRWRQSTVAKVEAAARPVRLNEAAALAELFGVPLGELLDESADRAAYRARHAAQEVGALHEIGRMFAYLAHREQLLQANLVSDA